MVLFGSIYIFILGLMMGSFISALTYRWPREISILKGRSFCPNCKSKINWYDNIPLLSYFILLGKCRNCGKKISPRYPLIELLMGIIFVVVFSLLKNCATTVQGTSLQDSSLCFWQGLLGWWALAYLLLIGFVMVSIFVTDFEHQLIPDFLVFLLLVVSFLAHILGNNSEFYEFLLSGFGAAFALLILHLLTHGRGMGLGDVKLAVPAGLILGWPNTLVWLYVSFIIGAVVGVILILAKRATFGRQIAFGPFLIVSFFITLFWGNELINIFLPFLR